MRKRLFGLVLVLASAGASCNEKLAPTQPTVGTPAPTVSAVGLQIVGSPSSSVGVGQTVPLHAAQLMNNGASSAVTAGVVWTSSAADVATVGADGVLLAKTPGSTTVTASYLTFTTTAVIRVASNWNDLDFRVAILNASASVPKSQSDVLRIFALANDMLFQRTGSRMRLIDMRDALPDTASRIATIYMESSPPEQPDGLIIWLEDETAVSAGGYSITQIRPAPYTNRFPATSGANRLFVSAIDYDHKYARCGYDSIGEVRISDRSANGECRNQNGLLCVHNGRFWTCPDTLNDFYAQPDVFPASVIVHEFLHPVGLAGNNDHYGTPTCTARVAMSAPDASDRAKAQWHMGQCPDLFLRFRPTGAPAAMGRWR